MNYYENNWMLWVTIRGIKFSTAVGVPFSIWLFSLSLGLYVLFYLVRCCSSCFCKTTSIHVGDLSGVLYIVFKKKNKKSKKWLCFVVHRVLCVFWIFCSLVFIVFALVEPFFDNVVVHHQH